MALWNEKPTPATAGSAVPPPAPPPMVASVVHETAPAAYGWNTVKNSNTNSVGEYTTSGATVYADLISGLEGPWGIAAVQVPEQRQVRVPRAEQEPVHQSCSEYRPARSG